jgi:uncharacterized protein (DUF58 family)
VAISGWFVLVLAAGAAPLVAIGQWWVLPAWLVFCALLGVVDLTLAASPRALRVSRKAPARIRLGESADATVRIENAGRRVLRAIVRDAWPPSAGAQPTRQRIRIPVGERRSLTTRLTPFRRGARHAAEVTVRSFGPMRLVARQASLRVPATVLVLPPFLARRHLPSRLARLRELDGSTSVMVRGQGTEFDSLRGYVRGDDVRSIDWRASARRAGAVAERSDSGLVVRTWRPERDRRVVVIVDTGRTSAARIGDGTRLDAAFESALLLTALASAGGDRVDLVLHDRRVRGRIQGATGPALLSRMVGAMATVEPELIESDWAAVPGLVRSAAAHRALVVLLTTPESLASARGLLAVIPELAAKHLVLVAAVEDPAVAEAAARRDRIADVHLAAAAERAAADRAEIASAVRRLGGDWVSAPPDALPPALADRYLTFKAAGRL